MKFKKILSVLALIGIVITGCIIGDFHNCRVTYDEATEMSQINNGYGKISTLREVNNDVIGYINIPNTRISYPIMKTYSGDWYKQRLWDGSVGRVGSIYIDSKCNSNFKDSYSIIWGSAPIDGSMFKSLIQYRDEKYLNEHNTIYLTTKIGNYEYKIFSVLEWKDSDSLSTLDKRVRKESIFPITEMDKDKKVISLIMNDKSSSSLIVSAYRVEE